MQVGFDHRPTLVVYDLTIEANLGIHYIAQESND